MSLCNPAPTKTRSTAATPKSNAKGGYSGNSVGNVTHCASIHPHTSLLKDNSSNALSTTAITTTTNDLTPSTSTKRDYYVNGYRIITRERSNDEHASLFNNNA